MTALSEQTRQVAVPGVGVASQLGDGTVRVSFSDGAQLLLRPNMDQVTVCYRVIKRSCEIVDASESH